MAAARLHARLKLDMSKPIDVFDVVQSERIWLKAEALGELFGFYIRRDEAVGVCVNSQHPETLQRYTCAHELGHHILGHGSMLDDREDIDRPYSGGPMQERQAQVFAGNFLMPLGLVNRTLRRLGMHSRSLAAADVYQLSREWDVSFTAAVWRLRSLNRLTQPAASAMARAGAATAKAAFRATTVTTPRADVWLFDQPVKGGSIVCRVGDEIRVRLQENPSTGWVWQEPVALRRSVVAPTWDGGDSLTLKPQQRSVDRQHQSLRRVADIHHEVTLTSRDEFGSTDDALDIDPETGDWWRHPVGLAGERELVWLAEEPGGDRISLELRPGWETPEDPVELFVAEVEVRPAHTLEGVARPQTVAHARRLSAA